MRINDLKPPAGSTRERIRIGRGHGSGKVKTGGKGTKGQNARTGGGVPPYFEGGQLPLIRKLPYRRGFRNPFRVEFRVVNVRDLAQFPTGSTVGPEEFEMAMGMAGLAFRRRTKDGGNVVVAFDVGLLGEVEIAAVCLALTRESSFEVVLGFGSLEIGHGFLPSWNLANGYWVAAATASSSLEPF